MKSNEQEISKLPLDEEAELILHASRSILDSGAAKQMLYAVTEIYINYIHNEHDALPANFDDVACSMIFLVNFLKDMVDIEEQRRSRNENAVAGELEDDFTSVSSTEDVGNLTEEKN